MINELKEGSNKEIIGKKGKSWRKRREKNMRWVPQKVELGWNSDMINELKEWGNKEIIKNKREAAERQGRKIWDERNGKMRTRKKKTNKQEKLIGGGKQ